MKPDHNEKKIREIMRLAGNFIEEESNATSLITVTNVEGKGNFHEATVFVTILPDHAEEDALNFLKRKRGDFRTYVKENSRIKFIPFFDFALDLGEKHRRKIDELSKEDEK